MKPILFLLLLFLMPSAYAQKGRELVVSEATGQVQLHRGKSREAVSKGQRLSDRDILILSQGSTLILLDPKGSRRYTVKGAYTGSTHNYAQRNQSTCVKTVTDKYMNYLLKEAFRAPKSSGHLEDDHATVFREGDSILEDSITLPAKSIDSLYHTIDSLSVVSPDSIAS